MAGPIDKTPLATVDTKRGAKGPGKGTHFAPVLRHVSSASEATRDDVDNSGLANLHTRLFQVGEPQ